MMPREAAVCSAVPTAIGTRGSLTAVAAPDLGPANACVDGADVQVRDSAALEAAPLLLARDLRLVLGGKAVLDGLSLQIQTGTVHALLGPNGSGKSSIACTIMGCSGYRPECGSISFAGERIDTLTMQ